MKNELNHLLKLNIDASKGYAFAAENIKNENFKNFLKTYSRQREKLADQIRINMMMKGFDVDYDTSLLGEIHQSIMRIKQNLSAHPDEQLIAECIRGEGESLSQYEKILKENILPNELQVMALEHLNKIRAAESTLHEIHQVI